MRPLCRQDGPRQRQPCLVLLPFMEVLARIAVVSVVLLVPGLGILSLGFATLFNTTFFK